jgi:predicted thioesterase
VSERVVRWSAAIIAILAFIDPPIVVNGRTRPRIGVSIQRGPSMGLPGLPGLPGSLGASDSPSASSAGTRRAVAEKVRDALRRDLSDDFDVMDGLDSSAAALVIVGDRYPETPPPVIIANVVNTVNTVTVSAPLAPNVRIAAVDAPRAVPPGTSVRLGVSVEGRGVRGAETVLTLHAGGAEVGRARHTWTSEEETWRADLQAVPVGAEPFRFEIEARPLASERSLADNRAAVLVAGSQRLRVLFFEARPSWASAFVRRALESDPRFEVSGLSQASPRAAIRTGGSPALPTDHPDAYDAFDTILVGGLDSLSPASVSTIDDFMRRRGGTVALLPDARPSSPSSPSSAAGSPAAPLLAGVELREKLLDRPVALVTTAAPRLDASELLEAARLPAGATVLAHSASSGLPVIWTAAKGDGLMLVSGAMDAWRYRAETGVDFDRFWRSVISGLALAARPAVTVEVHPADARPGDRVQVTARVRRLERERARGRLSLAASADGHPMRLWPDVQEGSFSGAFVVDPASPANPIRVEARLGDGPVVGVSQVAVDNSVSEASGPPLALLADSHAGVNVGADNLAALERHLRSTVSAQPARAARHPMRSAWWIVPFAACLSGEWWLRRRSGRR